MPATFQWSRAVSQRWRIARVGLLKRQAVFWFERMFLNPFFYIGIGLANFILAWLFPQDLYLEIVGESSRMFMNPQIFIFNAASIMLIVACTALSLRGSREFKAAPMADTLVAARTRAAFVLGVFFVFLHLASIYFVLRNVGMSGLLRALTSPQEFSSFQREQGGFAAAFRPIGLIAPMSACTALLYVYLWQTRHAGLKGRMLFLLCCATYVLAASTLGRRSYILRLALGVAIGYSLYAASRIRLSTVIGFALGLAAVVAGISVMGIVRRGADRAFEPYEFVRYYLAPYNAQAMIMSGELSWEGQNGGYYWTQFIWEAPVIGDLLNLRGVYEEIVGKAAPYGALDRAATLSHGGIRSGTALSAFGNSYVDFNWFGILPFAITGMLYGASRRWMSQGKAVGLVLFPVIAYSILDWRGNLQFPGPHLLVILGAIAMFHVCARILAPRDVKG